MNSINSTIPPMGLQYYNDFIDGRNLLSGDLPWPKTPVYYFSRFAVWERPDFTTWSPSIQIYDVAKTNGTDKYFCANPSYCTFEEQVQLQYYTGYIQGSTWYPANIPDDTKAFYDQVINGLVGGLCDGVSDAYSWVAGEGEQYTLSHSRPEYTGRDDSDILMHASAPIYFFEEGTAAGPVSPWLTMGGTEPAVGEWGRCVDLDTSDQVPDSVVGLDAAL